MFEIQDTFKCQPNSVEYSMMAPLSTDSVVVVESVGTDEVVVDETGDVGMFTAGIDNRLSKKITNELVIN
jgi:hypothetical protein